VSSLSADTLWELAEARARRTPDLVLAVDETGRELTFGELHDRALAVAAGMAALGVDEGATVSWQLPTWLESMVLVAALSRLGAVQNPLLPIYRERELRAILPQVRPAVVAVPTTFRGFAHRELAEHVVADEGLDTRVVVCDRTLPEGDPSNLKPFRPLAPGEDPLRWIFYTSGTTGEPKGARHTDASLLAGSLFVADAYAFVEGDRYPVVFPFTHVGGIGMFVISLATGAGSIVVEQFDPETTPPLLASHGVTMLAGGTPLALLYLAHQRRLGTDVRAFPALRGVITGAAPTPPDLHAELRDELGGTGSLACYGLTEMPFLTVSSVRDTDDQRARTVGRAVAGAEIRVVAPDGSSCPAGVVGEIRARGPQLCRGFVNPAHGEVIDADGFLRTGDLGTIDADGFVTITGRLKDIIIRKGENIAAKEVEDVLYTHPAVADVAVIGIPDPDLGERCCAVVVARDGASLTLPEVVAHCRAAGLANQKIPERLEVVADLPRNASAKVLKYELRERFGPS
jgi:acyl-CoA synthetase (AMP-forming)/AMP-acid ligase II